VFNDGGTALGTDSAFKFVQAGKLDIGLDANNNIFIQGGNTTTVGTNNVALGPNALSSLDSTCGVSECSYNVAVGRNALTAATKARHSTAIGDSALAAATTGYSNTGIGVNALSQTTTGYSNTGIGVNAMIKNTIGVQNVAVGHSALYSNKAKQKNTAIGVSAMYYADDDTTAADTYNTALGYGALQGSSTAANNTGVNNTALGALAGDSMTSGSNNILIGYNADMADPTDNYYLNIGNTLYGTLTAGGDPKIGVAKYCDDNLANCFVATDVGAALTSETNDLEGDGAANIADTEVFIGTGAGTGNYVTLSGDATLANDGTLSIAANAVGSSEIADGTVSTDDIAAD
ncbi:MAG: hypothetical protein KC897_13765, partial [Candidatus Omnitrophica bacterium]|nr:hypothetical protein [Candidatus Omnitrophota bacterium]